MVPGLACAPADVDTHTGAGRDTHDAFLVPVPQLSAVVRERCTRSYSPKDNRWQIEASCQLKQSGLATAQLRTCLGTAGHLELDWAATAATTAAGAALAQAEQEGETQREDGREDHASGSRGSAGPPHAALQEEGGVAAG